MKKINIIAVILLIGIVIVAYFYNTRNSKTVNSYNVGLVYLLQHPAIKQGIEGFKSELKQIEKETGKQINVTYSNAFGEPKNVNSIISSFVNKDMDLIIALTTPCAQITKKIVKNKPIIFVGVSDPVEAGLTQTLQKGFENITGTTSRDPNFETLEFASKIFPKMKKVGIVYTATEANSVSILKSLEEKIKKNHIDIEIFKKPISTTTEILPTSKFLFSNTDAMFLINDNTIISSIDLLIKLSNETKKPIFASDIESVKKGALFTYGLNYKDEGIAAAKILDEILIKKIKPSEIPVYVNKKYYLYVNKKLFDYKTVDTTLVKGAKIIE